VVSVHLLDHRLQYWRPPEALSGEESDIRSNVYAYGMLIYEVLFHRVPYQDEDQEVSLMLSFLPTSLLKLL
jgi:serine/threonine protein kinase